MATLRRRGNGLEHGCLVGRNEQGFDHAQKGLRGVQVGIIVESVGEEVSAIGTVATEAVEADTSAGAGEEGQDGRGAGEEFHVHGCVDPGAADLARGAEHVEDGAGNAGGADGEDVFPGDEFHGVEDETVFLEYPEIDVLAADELDRAANGVVGEDGGPLLDEFDEDDLFRRALGCAGSDEKESQSAQQRQKQADRLSDPAIDDADAIGIHGNTAPTGDKRRTLSSGGALTQAEGVSCSFLHDWTHEGYDRGMADPQDVTLEMSDGYSIRSRWWPGSGDGVSVVYLHGIQSHGEWFLGTASRLAASGAAVLLPDRRGSGLNREARRHAPSGK